MEALIGKPDCNLLEQLSIAVQDESLTMPFHMSPLGTPEHPGKFQDVNVLGMDFLALHHLSLLVHTPVSLFQLVDMDHQSMFAHYPGEEELM
jgi:hypothetical protein